MAGAAAAGLRPIAELMFVDFIGVAMDQLFNQAAKMHYMFGGKAKVPMVLRMPQGAGVSAAAQHSQCLEAWFMHMPGIKVCIPSTPADAKGMLISAIRDDNPVVFLEHKLLYGVEGEVDDAVYEIPLGKGEIKREGTDVTVVATSLMVHKALEAAEKLAAEGISVEVVDPRCLVPLDKDIILNSVKKTHALVVAHEAVKTAGAGAEIAAMVAEALRASGAGVGDLFAAAQGLDGLLQRVLPAGAPLRTRRESRWAADAGDARMTEFEQMLCRHLAAQNMIDFDQVTADAETSRSSSTSGVLMPPSVARTTASLPVTTKIRPSMRFSANTRR